MTPSFFVEILVNGICQGSIYALFAIGYTLIVGVLKMVSFTHGEVIVVGAFAALYISYVCPNILVCLIGTFIVTALLGVFIHKVCYERFLDAPKHISVITTIGMSMLLKNAIQVFITTETKGMTKLIPSGSVSIGSVNIGYVPLIVVGIVILLSIILSLFMKKTKMGIMLRAVSQDRKAAALVGIPVKRITMLGNVIGCGIGGIGGMLYALYYGSLSASIGGPASLKAFCSSALGGMTDIVTAAGSGVVIGIIENFGVTFFASSMRNLVAFLLLIIVLLIKPEGLQLRSRKG